MGWLKSIRCRIELPQSADDNKFTLVNLSNNQLLTTVLSQHRFHIVQAINSGTQLSLIFHAHCLCIRDVAPKIHFHLSLFLGDSGSNDRRSFLWGDIGLP